MMKTGKKIMAVIAALGLSVWSIYSQMSEQEEQTIEVQGIKNTYIQREIPDIYSIWNKNNKLKDIEPSYLFFQRIPPIQFANKALLDEIIQQHLGEYFKKYKGVYKYSSILYFFFYGDIDGNIKEIYMSYPKEIGLIPVTVFEALEEDILKSEVKLIFDKNHRVFKGSAWVGKQWYYDPNKIRDIAKRSN